jgi:putative CocE/NonD family hydrolase
MRRRLLLLIAYAVAVAVVVTALVAVLHPRKKTFGKAVTAQTQILGAAGTMLGGHVYIPAGSGKHPLLIMPASWGSTADQYRLVAQKFAAEGYVVVAYAQRGFPTSQGQVDFAGYPTQADESAVIAWALRHTPADPNAIGAIGVSYGAGVSLLAAERDPRIKAVVAMSTWADLQSSIFPNRTPNKVAVSSLFSASTIARSSAPLAAFERNFLLGDFGAATTALTTLSAIRSPITLIAALNKNHPAVMIANDFQDSYFAPGQLVTFFDQLTGPKRLQLAPGDHGGQETPGLQGKPSKVWDDATAWLDHYLRGTNNGIQSQPPVQLQDMTTGAWHAYSSFPTAPTTPGASVYLTAGSGDAGSLAATPSTGWSRQVDLGAATVAMSPPIQLGTYPYQGVSGVKLKGVSPSAAGTWGGTALTGQTTIDGQPSVHLTVTSSAASATLFAYLYDTDPSGSSALITTAPYAMTNLTPGTPSSITFDLRPISWTVAAGHHLSLVITTADPRYVAPAGAGQTVTFSSPAADPSALTIPTG